MGKALELVSARATAPGAGAVMAPVAGNSFTIRDTKKPVNILAAWQQRQAAGWTRITSPLGHDGVVGVQAGGPAGDSLLMMGNPMPLYPQDTLSIQGSGSSVAGDIEQSCMLVMYDDVAGVDANLITVAELKKRMIDFYSWQNTLATNASGDYSGQELINAEQDQLKANTYYAILGCNVQVGAAAVRWVGPDFGNLGLGMPAATTDRYNARFFVDLAEATGKPCIPVFNSANKSLTFVDALTNENGVDMIITTMAVRLA